MKVDVKCFGNLSRTGKCHHTEATEVELTEGERVKEIMKAFGITEEEARIIFVNHRVSQPGTLLKDGDRVSLVPATGGM